MAKKKQKFMRTDFRKYSKLGVRRKNKQKYRKAKGIDNKIRLKMKGHVRGVSIGFGSDKKQRGLIQGLNPVIVHNIKELSCLLGKDGDKKNTKKEIAVIAKIGGKKRKELLDYAIKNNIKLSVDGKKALEKIEINLKKAKDKKAKRKAKKIERDKKAKKEAEKKAKQEAKEAKKEIQGEKTEKKEEKPTEKKSEEKTNEKPKEQSTNISQKSEGMPTESKKLMSRNTEKSNKKEIKSNNYGRGN